MASAGNPEHGFTNRVVRAFLESNLSIVLIVLASAIGAVALVVTPREEDPQIVVPMADVLVSYPGRSAAEIEQLVATPLERGLSQIDGVENVYSASQPDQAVVTVRFHVGQDRERSLVKLYKRLEEHRDVVPAEASWVVKPIEIDDVPIVTLTLTSRTVDAHGLRRVGEEMVQRLSGVADLSRAYVVGGPPRVVRVQMDPARLEARGVSPLQIGRALAAASRTLTAGTFERHDAAVVVEAGRAFSDARELGALVVAVGAGGPVHLSDVADVVDGPDDAESYVRHAWGPAHSFPLSPGAAGTRLGGPAATPVAAPAEPEPAVTIALAKKKGSNAVRVADRLLEAAAALRDEIVPDGVDVVVTRNYGLTADEKVDELVEALLVAVVIVVGLLVLTLGWREAFIVAVAVPLVFGLTLAVNELAGLSINRVTLFAIILSLGLLVDDPIVDVENISRHFAREGRVSRDLVLKAVAEIRPPLVSATLAVILSFLPMLGITGMSGPYMRPMALNVPVAMLMSMVVAFTITPWLSYHLLKKRYATGAAGHAPAPGGDDLESARKTRLWRLFYPLMAPLLSSRRRAWLFVLGMGLLTAAAVTLAALRAVPLKMLPFDNKNELLLVLDLDDGTTLERTDAAVRDFERHLMGVPEVADVTSYVGTASPMDFNGMVRHYYLKRGGHVAEIRVNLVGKKNRPMQSHAIGLRLRADLDALARRHRVRLKLVETPPGPPVLQTLVGEVYGAPHQTYPEIASAAKALRARFEREPGVVDVDDSVEAPQKKLVFVTDKEKAALHGVTVDDVAQTLRAGLGGWDVSTVRAARERQELKIRLELPRRERSGTADLSRLRVAGAGGLVPLSELGRWEETLVDGTIHHKDLERVVYVLGDTAGRAPAEAILDIAADQRPAGATLAAERGPRPLAGRTYLSNGSGLPWSLPAGMRVAFAGEGEWKITRDVFRDLGLGFLGALIAIYVLLVWQTKSFVVPVVVMLAIPLTAIGVMPGFFLLNAVAAGRVGAFADPIFFTATAMVGMIALAGIVTRDSIILVDFIQLSLRRGRSLVDAILESRVVRLRPILLTAGAAMLSALPITIDPIFSGLAWSLIFGLLSSTVFTLFVVPVAYGLIYGATESPAPAAAAERDTRPARPGGPSLPDAAPC